MDVTDDNKGGSQSPAGDANTPPPAGKETENKTVKMSMDEALAENTSLKKRISEKDEIIKDLTTQLKQANDFLESQDKARLIGDILPRSQFKIEDLAKKTPEELKNIRLTLDQAIPPKVNSVRYGISSADVADRERGLTVGDLSVVTAAKRKQGGS